MNFYKSLYLISASLFLLFILIPVGVEAGGFWQAPGMCTGVDCNACHLINLMNIILDWLFGIMFIIFGFIIIVAGFELVTSGGNPGNKESAKKKLYNSLIGIIIVMAAWLIIDDLMRTIVGDNISGWGPWNKIECVTNLKPNDPAKNIKAYIETAVEPAGAVDGFLPAGYVVTDSDGKVLSDGEARKALEAAGINFKDSASVAGLRDSAVNGVIALNSAVGANLTITSGTDGKHAGGKYSHSQGYKVDFRTSDAAGQKLVGYLQSGTDFKRTGTWKTGEPVYSSNDGKTTCAIESDHVDCRFLP